MPHDFSDEDFWLRIRSFPIHTNYLILLAVHGNLCLALRHPSNRGENRTFVVAFVKALGLYFLHAGALTQEELEEAQRIEVEEGSADLG